MGERTAGLGHFCSSSNKNLKKRGRTEGDIIGTAGMKPVFVRTRIHVVPELADMQKASLCPKSCTQHQYNLAKGIV